MTVRKCVSVCVWVGDSFPLDGPRHFDKRQLIEKEGFHIQSTENKIARPHQTRILQPVHVHPSHQPHATSAWTNKVGHLPVVGCRRPHDDRQRQAQFSRCSWTDNNQVQRTLSKTSSFRTADWGQMAGAARFSVAAPGPRGLAAASDAVDPELDHDHRPRCRLSVCAFVPIQWKGEIVHVSACELSRRPTDCADGRAGKKNINSAILKCGIQRYMERAQSPPLDTPTIRDVDLYVVNVLQSPQQTLAHTHTFSQLFTHSTHRNTAIPKPPQLELIETTMNVTVAVLVHAVGARRGHGGR